MVVRDSSNEIGLKKITKSCHLRERGWNHSDASNIGSVCGVVEDGSQCVEVCNSAIYIKRKQTTNL
jgi:hypothetical protein